ESHFGYDPDANYFIATPPGHSTYDFAAWINGICARHNNTLDSFHRQIAFTNFPYMSEAGWGCGADTLHDDYDGVTIVAGHEFAEVITDPQPTARNAWWDFSTRDEIADTCDWGLFGRGSVDDITLP